MHASGTEAQPRGWWENRYFLTLVALLMAAPLVWPPFPPLVDLPGHMGRYKVEIDLANSAALQQFYGFKWQLMGNLGIDLLIVPLEKLVGLELGVKLIVMSVPVLTTVGLLSIAREVHGRIPPTVFFALPFVYGYPFRFGFINYVLSMALALCAFALWLRLARNGHDGLRAALFVPLGLLLWLCHTFGWGVLGVAAFSAELIRQHDKVGGWLRALLNAGIHCLSLAPPALLVLLWRSEKGVGAGTLDWFNWDDKWISAMQVLADRWATFDVGSLFLVLLVLVLALRARTYEYSRHLRATALMLFAVFLCLPRVIFGSAYADMRLFPFVLAIALVAIRPRATANQKLMNVLAALALLFCGVRIAANTVSYGLFSVRQELALGALEHLPMGARLVSFVGSDCRKGWYSNRLGHLPAFAIVRREAFSNDQWALAGAQLLTIIKDDAPEFVSDPSQIVLLNRCGREFWLTMAEAIATVPRDAFDYVWLIEPPALTENDLRGLTPIWTNGTDSLYRIERHSSVRRK